MIYESCIYPGHPIVIACYIMNEYLSLESASSWTGQCPEALGNYRIPGGGGSVYAALDVLSSIKGGSPVKKEIIRAADIWPKLASGYSKERIKEGQEQADRFEEEFLNNIYNWLSIESKKEHALKSLLS